MALAIAHILGALLVSVAFGLLVLFIGSREQELLNKRRLQDASIALGVAEATLNSDESLLPRIVEYSSQRFSSELLRNRISDLCGALRTVWGWLGSLLQVGIVLGVGWSMYTNGAGSAAVMWAVPAVAVFFWLVSVAFSFTSLLLTGRYPGEARMARKALISFIEQQGEPAARGAAEPL